MAKGDFHVNFIIFGRRIFFLGSLSMKKKTVLFDYSNFYILRIFKKLGLIVDTFLSVRRQFYDFSHINNEEMSIK